MKNSSTQVQLVPPEGKSLFPHDGEYEDLAVGLALRSADAAEVLLDGLIAEDFFTTSASKHFAGIVEIAKRGENVDIPALQLQLGDACEREYLTTVSERVLPSVNAESLVRTIRDFTKRRGAVRESLRIAQAAILSSDPANQQLEAARTAFDRLSDDHASERGFEDAPTIVARLRAAQDERPPEGIRTGIADFDDLLGRRAFGPGDLIVGAARTGVGKSAWAIQVSTYVATYYGLPVIYFSLEMNGDDVLERAAIGLSRVNADDVRDHSMNPQQAIAYDGALTTLAQCPFSVDCEGSNTVRRIRRMARRYQRKHGGRLGLVVVDYIQLLTSSPGERHETRALEVATHTRALKALAMELKVPVLALSQLNRDPAKTDARPRLHHLRESGAIEQDADVVVLIHRASESGDEERKSVPGSEDWVPAGQAKFYLAKRRGGKEGAVSVRWSGEFQRFDNLYRHGDGA